MNLWQRLIAFLRKDALLGLSRLEAAGVVAAAAVAFVLFSPPGPPTLAQYVGERGGALKVIDDGVITLAGAPAHCNHLPIVLDDVFEDHAAAWPQTGFMIVNRKFLDPLPRVQQLFTFYHECGHMNGVEGELAADCYSIKAGAKAGWLDAAGVETLCQYWRPLAGDATHPAGVERCANMQRCFREARN